MGKNITEKILQAHQQNQAEKAGEPVTLKIDQTLTQDATGTMAYLQLEAMGVDQVKTDLSVSYIDHNTLQSGFMNADDHAYLQSMAARHGIVFSKPGNGICHQVHLERFAKPGATLLGSDSHTPTAGAMGSLAMGAGGLDVAKAMAGLPYTIAKPKVIQVYLTGALQPGASAKDVILELLKRRSVKGGVNSVFEYSGPGVENLSIYQRATITNMGAELGATTSIFPSDETTRKFLADQHREQDFIELRADEDALYDEREEIDLSSITPKAAMPHSPDAVRDVRELAGMKIDQVNIGSCTNSGYEDLMKAAEILKGHHVADHVSLTLSPGSRQVLAKLMDNGALRIFLDAGARILECTCGPCIGMGQSPKSEGISLRTFNRNFYGRSGTNSAGIYLVSPETAAFSAIKGVLADPMEFDYNPDFLKDYPVSDAVDDSLILQPSANPEEIEIIRGPNIKPLPIKQPLENEISAKVSIKVGDNITTDDIAPAGAAVLPYRSNIDKLSTFAFKNQKEDFYDLCKKLEKSFIVAGENYGQGSSREHAAMAPMHLGVQAVLAKSFARIHLANLINFGLLPLQFIHPEDYETIDELDELIIENLDEQLENPTILVKNLSKGSLYEMEPKFGKKDIDVLKAGGMLNWIRNQI